MRSGRRLGLTATRFLRYLLPICLVAATAVAGMGLVRVVGRNSTPELSQAAVSLTLGSPGTTITNAPTPSASPSVAAPKSVSTTPAAVPKIVPVTSAVAILNASTIRGLASRTAALLRRKGVRVEAVDNLHAAQKPSQGTVFYPPGQGAQAHTLASLSGATDVEPAPDWIATDGRLVLVVTDLSSASGPLAGQ